MARQSPLTAMELTLRVQYYRCEIFNGDEEKRKTYCKVTYEEGYRHQILIAYMNTHIQNQHI